MSDKDPEAKRGTKRGAIDELQRAVDETEHGLTPEKKRNLRRAVRREQETRDK